MTWLDDLPAIDLSTLNDAAARQSRVDRKYLLTLDELTELGAHLGDCSVLEIAGQRSGGYSSLYLDTPDLQAYHLAGLERRRRFKVRIRTYASTGEQYLEVKTRDGRGMTHKVRQLHDGSVPLSASAQGFVDTRLSSQGIVLTGPLEPVLTTSYERTTLYLPGDGARATLDLGVRFATAGDEVALDNIAVVETKGGTRPTSFDRLLSALGHRETRMSKYGVGMAALHPELHPEKWAATMRRTLHLV
ncbi:VTC domain-containing protein [Corynebacterium doosanense]|nr:VTC domain-containing protein [Corynebacterium doosanense]